MAYRIGAVLVAVALGLMAASGARAWCLENAGSAGVHVQALDARFKDNVAAGESVCCAAGRACRAADGTTDLRIVTGYEPVEQAGGDPGWTAECRVGVPDGRRVRVTGDAAALQCRIAAE